MTGQVEFGPNLLDMEFDDDADCGECNIARVFELSLKTAQVRHVPSKFDGWV